MSIDDKAIWPGWETVRLIGRGSFGAVYEIERDVLGEKERAALKVISIPQSDSDIIEMYSDGYDDESITSTFNEYLKSIVSEYSLMRKLNGSSNVVNCDDVRYVQHDDGLGWDIFIKMELLKPLTAVLPAKVSEEQIIKIAKDICRALVQCKQFGIVHRDIKPQNIFVSPLGDYKLGDFGIAKTVEKTSGGTKIGTYKYMAPEVYNNQPYGAGADIYSLGLVLYWLLNERRMPFLPLPPEKLCAGLEEQARLRRFNGERIPAPAHGSEELKKIVLKACAYNPEDRYQTATEMQRALSELSGLENAINVDPLPFEVISKKDITGADISNHIDNYDGTETVDVWDIKKLKQELDSNDRHGELTDEKTTGAFAGTEGKFPSYENIHITPNSKLKVGLLRSLIFGVAIVVIVGVIIAVKSNAETLMNTETHTESTEQPNSTQTNITSSLDHSHPLGEAGFNGLCSISAETFNGTVYYHRESSRQIKAASMSDLSNSTVVWRASGPSAGNINKLCVINNYIFFNYQPSGNGEYVLARIDIDGSNYTELTNLSDNFLHPYYIDGWIYGNMGTTLVRVAADGSGYESLTNGVNGSLFLLNGDNGVIAYYNSSNATYSYQVNTGETKKILDCACEHISMYNGFLYASVYNGNQWQIWRFAEDVDPTIFIERSLHFVILDDMMFYEPSGETDLYAINMDGTNTKCITLPFELSTSNSSLRFISGDGYVAIKGKGGVIYLYMPEDGSIVELP